MNKNIDELKEKNKSKLTNYGKYDIKESNEAKRQRMSLAVPEFFDYEEFHDIANTYSTSDLSSILIYNEEETVRREDQMYDILKRFYPDIIRNYVSNEYPWPCTFYIPSIDVYIENRCGWEHGGHPYSTKKYDEILFNDIYDSEQYEDALYIWSELDVQQREYAKKRDLKWVEYYRSLDCIVLQLIHIEETHLKFEATDSELKQEWKSLSNSEGRLSNNTASNKIVKYFQPKLSENAASAYFDDYKNKWKIFDNRHFYCPIRWEDINNNVIIRGMSICGKADAYSMFNPKLIRWFIEKEKLQETTCYDPTGGWGHRMLGASSLVKKYIYNDLSKTTVKGIENIINYLGIKNVEVNNEDATYFIPDCDFDFMFTCPPYYAENHDIEKYECEGFHSKEEFDTFLNTLYNIYKEKESCRVFGIVLREDILTDLMKTNIDEMYPLKLNANHFQRAGGKKRFTEYLYIFRKR